MHGLFRIPHRAGTYPRGREQADRRRHALSGSLWLEFTLTGREAHTGSTPMDIASMRASQWRGSSKWSRPSPLKTSRAPSAGVPDVFFAQFGATSCRAKWCSPSTSAHPTRPNWTGMRAGSKPKRQKSASGSASAFPSRRVGHFDPVTFDPKLVETYAGPPRSSATAT